jgi:hypothetical protein
MKQKFIILHKLQNEHSQGKTVNLKVVLKGSSLIQLRQRKYIKRPVEIYERLIQMLQ